MCDDVVAGDRSASRNVQQVLSIHPLTFQRPTPTPPSVKSPWLLRPLPLLLYSLLTPLHTPDLTMGLFDKIKNKMDGSGAPPASNHSFPPAQAPIPLEHSLQRYRRQRGINLGSWFVTENWLSTKLYASLAVDRKGSDFDLARGKDAKAAMEHHWDTWITDDDWNWIKQRGFNSVRLPVSTTLSTSLLLAHSTDRILPPCRCAPRRAAWHRLRAVRRRVLWSMDTYPRRHRQGCAVWSWRSR